MMARARYDYRNCQSRLGYAAAVHRRSGCVCQLCGAQGGTDAFDFWRQLTVEHLIGERQGGYLREIKLALDERFPEFAPGELAALAERLDEANTVSACSFCNATTSRNRADTSMRDLIVKADDPESLEASVRVACAAILEAKRADVAWKIESLRHAYDELVEPAEPAARNTQNAG